MSEPIAKVLSPVELAALLDEAVPRAPAGRNLDDIIIPTAEDLLALVDGALKDAGLDGMLTGVQREEVRVSLIARLGVTLLGDRS